MTKFTIEDLRDIAYRGSYDDLERELALQLLASMEQAPVYLRPFGDDGETFVACDGNDERAITLYSAPQLPQPAVVSDVTRKDFEAWARAAGFNEDWYFFTNVHPNHYDDDHINDMWAAWNACRAAMLQGAELVTDNTNQQFESFGLVVTSDERKMELPRCSKHPETELQVHPFEMLLSYPPKPAMYCPLCRPSVAKWVEFDNQLRQWKEVK